MITHKSVFIFWVSVKPLPRAVISLVNVTGCAHPDFVNLGHRITASFRVTGRPVRVSQPVTSHPVESFILNKNMILFTDLL